jgi:CRP-like cAMP-binding protein
MAVDPDVLLDFPDLGSLSYEDRRVMAASLKESRFKPGAQVCREGDVGDSCWFLVSGSVEVTKVLPDGRRVKLATLGAGSALGQSGLVEGQARTAEIKSLDDVYILDLTRKALRWSLGRGEPWAVAVQAIVAVNLVRQLRSALGRLSELAAAENASTAATGRTRDQIVRPKSVEADFSKLAAKHAAKSAAARAQAEIAAELADYDAADMVTNQGLMNLLRDTETGLSGTTSALDEVEFLIDEDARRTAAARASKAH